jgi:hypothetical protein
VEPIVGEGERREVRERGRERAGVARGVERDAGDAEVGGVGRRVAAQASGERGAGVAAGEVPRREARVRRDGHRGLERRERRRIAREGGRGRGRDGREKEEGKQH